MFPADAVAAIAAEANALRHFTMPQIMQAATAYETWHDHCLDKADRQALMKASGIEVIRYPTDKL